MLRHVEYHNERLNLTRHHFFNTSAKIDLVKIISVPEDLDSKTYKCRIEYDQEIQKVEFIEYPRPEIKSLKLIEVPKLNYNFKYANRSELEKLYQLRETSDDILIVKKGLITDTSYANVALKKGNQWFTPDKPLLSGTARKRLIAEGRLVEARILVDDLKKYDAIKIINAMNELDESCVATLFY